MIWRYYEIGSNGEKKSWLTFFNWHGGTFINGRSQRTIFAFLMAFMLHASKWSQNYLLRFMWIHKANWLSPSCAGNSPCSIHQLSIRKKSESLSLWTVGSKLYENPSDGFYCSSYRWGSAFSLWLIIHYPMRYSDSSTSSLDQHIWIENKKEIHNLYFTKYSWAKNKFYFYVIFTQLEKSKMRWWSHKNFV